LGRISAQPLHPGGLRGHIAVDCGPAVAEAQSLEIGHSNVTSAGRPRATLESMSDADFAAFVGATVPAYAADKVASGQWSEEQSLDLARRELEELLPRGRLTAGHHLFNVVDSAGGRVGTLWIAEKVQAGKRIAYVYDLLIRPECRRQGYAIRALQAAEEQARQRGLCGVGLHVFGHNSGARLLYEKLGYRATNVNMFKPL